MTDLRAIAEQLIDQDGPLIYRNSWAKLVERAMRLAIEATAAQFGFPSIMEWENDHLKAIAARMLELMKAEAQSSEINESDSLKGLPMVLRPTGRTIPDLTKREHVCEYQALMKAKAKQ